MWDRAFKRIDSLCQLRFAQTCKAKGQKAKNNASWKILMDFLFLKYGEIVFHSLIFMVDLITNLMNRSHHKYEIKKYYSLYFPENTSELFVWIWENLSPNWLDWDQVQYLDMGLNFDLTVERGKVAFTVRAITSASAKKILFYTSKTYFFYFTLLFLQNPHISLSIIHFYLNKIFIFFFTYFLHCLSLSLSDLTTIIHTTQSVNYSIQKPFKIKSSPTQD